MKIIIFVISMLFVATFSAKSQHNMQLEPVRSAFNITSGDKFEMTKDSSVIKKHYAYNVSKHLVAILVTTAENKNTIVFFATKEEYSFLKSQVNHVSMQIVLDSREFMGYSKIVYY